MTITGFCLLHSVHRNRLSLTKFFAEVNFSKDQSGSITFSAAASMLFTFLLPIVLLFFYSLLLFLSSSSFTFTFSLSHFLQLFFFSDSSFSSFTLPLLSSDLIFPPPFFYICPSPGLQCLQQQQDIFPIPNNILTQRKTPSVEQHLHFMFLIINLHYSLIMRHSNCQVSVWSCTSSRGWQGIQSLKTRNRQGLCESSRASYLPNKNA